ncbi:hypothetical protein OIDMADRAFT_52336 [Oidiodendron maius Zn]|uniref:Uncharacterized protein n=1 Tax=Oidiodendron maius (strain Zn) TaxID=913774 RepID=A0A0C3DKK2_OIDMZ|nr:hypothetical protein OIDMADRAFT_52336 [Oidiodendron maius Zn]
MSFPPRHSSPPKRPRLSLQIDTPSTAQAFGKSSTALKADIDPSSPTALNTLSNAYVAAIDTSSPSTAIPLPGSKPNPLGRPISLRLETKVGDGSTIPAQRTNTPAPFAISYPDTPISVVTPHPDLSSLTTANTFTPPLSASSTDLSQPKFTFAANVADNRDTSSPRTLRRRATIGSQYQAAPYTHPRTLHSILRNSPLPPRSTITPGTPTRMSARIANRAAKKVGYNDPLTQTIITNKYVKSHIELLAEDSPCSATDPESAVSDTLESAMAYSGDETRDGGQTPGPFEEMRRRMADSDLSSPTQKKRKSREKKRKWEWTITAAETDEEERSMDVDPTPITAFKVEETPCTAIWREASISTDEASDAETSMRERSVDLPRERRAEFLYPGQLERRESQDSDDRPRTSQSL